MLTPFETRLSDAEGHRRRTGRPYVTLSWAQSIDGSISTRRGTTLSLSGKESLQMTHRLRAAHEAIAVGIGTVLSDDPQLTVRLVEGRNPQAVILDSHLALPEQARILEHPTPPWIATLHPANLEIAGHLTARGAQVIQLPPDSGGKVDLHALLDRLAEAQINSILVEGGARVITSFLKSRMADHIIVTITPIFVGGLRVVDGLLSPMPRLKDVHSTQLGDDIIVWGAPAW